MFPFFGRYQNILFSALFLFTAGIAICKKGFPNKMLYSDFKARYLILAADNMPCTYTDIEVCKAVLDCISLEGERYRLGHTKVFFRAGALGYLEEVRESKIGNAFSWLTAMARGKASRILFRKMAERSHALICIQRSLRSYLLGKHWRWWELWLSVKPKLKGNDFEKLKEKFEAKINLAEMSMDKAVKECDLVAKEHELIVAEKNQYELALKDGGSIVEEVINKTKRLEQMKNDLQKQVEDVKTRVKEEENIKASITMQKEKLKHEGKKLGNEVAEDVDKVKHLEEERSAKEDQIRLMKDEIVSQEEIILLLNTDKRSSIQWKQNNEETIQAIEDKCNHLSQVKIKLEQALDETEDDIEKEKKSKIDLEKIKRKIEDDLKVAQEVVQELSTVKLELTSTVQRKDKEIASLTAKIEDEQSIRSKYNKQSKELNYRLEEIDEDLVKERANRTKADQARLTLSRDIEDLSSRLEDAGNQTKIQIEMGKKRDEELQNLKSQFQESSIQHESLLAGLRKKHNTGITEMKENIDVLNKMKSKAEKDKGNLERDLNECRTNLQEAMQEKNILDKNAKVNQSLIVESNQKLADCARAINEADSTKKKMQVEGQDLERQIDVLEKANSQLSKEKVSLETRLEDVKRLMEAETKNKSTILSKYKHTSNEMEGLKERFEEVAMKKSELIRVLSKARADIQLWKTKYETEGLGRIEELQEGRSKLNACIQEGEETIESIRKKVTNTEKINQRMETDLEEIQLEYERVHAAATINEQRSRNFDKVTFHVWKIVQ